MYKKILNINNIVVETNGDNIHFYFEHKPDVEAFYDIKKEDLYYNDFDIYNSMYLDFFLDKNEEVIDRLKNWSGSIEEFPYQFLQLD